MCQYDGNVSLQSTESESDVKFQEKGLPQFDGNVSLISNECENSDVYTGDFIPVHISYNRSPSSYNPGVSDRGKPVRVTVRRNNRVFQAISLPVVININPCSIYNKCEEFSLLLEQYNADIICISESFEREKLPLQEVLDLENYEIISMVKRRDFKGGNPAILVNRQKYTVKKICPDPITVPVGVEAIWALVSPINNLSKKFKNIAICYLYYRGPKSTKKQELFDHVAETFHYLSARFGTNMEFIIAGDTNRLNLSPILNLSPRLEQKVKVPTRLNPDVTLDPIITTLGKYYLDAVTKPPINPDNADTGRPSDHLVVLMRPLSASLPVPPRVYKTVKTQPITESGLQLFRTWIEEQRWLEVYSCSDVDKKAAKFQAMIMDSFKKCFPVKTFRICEDDQPWISKSLKKLDRLRKREFFKHKKSPKWEYLNKKFLEKCEEEKIKYYDNIVAGLKESNISQWYSKVKRMAGQLGPSLSPDMCVEELSGLSDQEQAERIADHYASISSQYEPIISEDFPEYRSGEFKPPKISVQKVVKVIKSMNRKAAAVPGDLPMRIIAEFCDELSRPLTHLINSCLTLGKYPAIWKLEYVTPVPKVLPPEKLKDLRKISGLLNFSKITDKILAEFIAEDMKCSRDKSQYGNQKKIGTQHYLVNMMHKILSSLDEVTQNKSIAVLLQMIDWSQAFDRMSHTLGIQSFVKNGVRPSIIPVLISFFQNREMVVKWKGLLSRMRPLPGGGPQGGTLGIEEYLSQNKDNVEFLKEDEKFKFIDDLSILEIINLLSIGLANYNIHNHVPSDIGTDRLYIDSANLKSQEHLEKISSWTDEKKMKLNTDKTNYMVFNFSKKFQFNTRLRLNEEKLDQVHQAKLLGLIIRDDLSWKANTAELTRRAYSRMVILKKLVQFDVPMSDLVLIYTLYIRSLTEQSSVVWHSSITKGEQKDLERTQKVALKIILGQSYSSYADSLKVTGLETLSARRTKLSLNFAKKCAKNDSTSWMFPLKVNTVDIRDPEKFIVTNARTERLFNSAIHYIQRLLNADWRKRK